MKWVALVFGLLVLALLAVMAIGMILPKAHTVTRSLNLHQSPDAVYGLISGPPSWRSNIRGYEPLGSVNGKPTWREIDAQNNGITLEEEVAEPPKKRVTRIADENLPFGGTWTYEIVPANGGSNLRITENGEVYNPVFRFVNRFITGQTATIDQYLKDVAKHFNEPATIEN